MSFEVSCRKDIYDRYGYLAAKDGETAIIKAEGKGNIRQVYLVNLLGEEHDLGKLSDPDCYELFYVKLTNILEPAAWPQ